ncbi:tyrosine-type recombinase/integrase [Kitasatospora sp. NPDC058444]|uniref:tyrosine-type recombinase/integrase n=1 Tax=Kitasatospora sp. NPDC058444 TaxID=3346504 RepID=UPI0036574301
MASIRVRERKQGGVTYTVTWRDGGARGAKQESERFGDETSAEQFRKLVEGHGEHWPPGWVRGRGFVEEEPEAPEVDPAHMFEAYAMNYVNHLTGVQGDTKAKYRKLIARNMVPWFREYAVADGPLVLPTEAVKAWVNDLAAGNRAPHDPPGHKRRKYKAKTIRDNHGLLSAILQAAASGDDPLRRSNPCLQTALPRADDGDSEVKTFLEHWEAGLVLRCLAADALDLIQVMFGTGLRWGEATALQVRDLDHLNGRPILRVSRTWKYDEEGTRVTGAPKSKKSRRVLVLTPLLASILARAAKGKKPGDLLFTAPEGGAWWPGSFWRLRWNPAIEAAAAEGLTKRPRLHDTRHTHAAWLIARNIPLPAISARLGHESIQTTVDEYGHLLAILDDDLVAAVAFAMEAALSPVIPDDVRQAVELSRAAVLVAA